MVTLSGRPAEWLPWKQFRALGSAALSLCDVAAGAVDGLVDGGAWHAPWDYLGGLLICREAGAEVVDAAGRELVVTDPDVRRQLLAAGTPALLEELRQALPDHGPGRVTAYVGMAGRTGPPGRPAAEAAARLGGRGGRHFGGRRPTSCSKAPGDYVERGRPRERGDDPGGARPRRPRHPLLRRGGRRRPGPTSGGWSTPSTGPPTSSTASRWWACRWPWSRPAARWRAPSTPRCWARRGRRRGAAGAFLDGRPHPGRRTAGGRGHLHHRLPVQGQAPARRLPPTCSTGPSLALEDLRRAGRGQPRPGLDGAGHLRRLLRDRPRRLGRGRRRPSWSGRPAASSPTGPATPDAWLAQRRHPGRPAGRPRVLLDLARGHLGPTRSPPRWALGRLGTVERLLRGGEGPVSGHRRHVINVRNGAGQPSRCPAFPVGPASPSELSRGAVRSESGA